MFGFVMEQTTYISSLLPLNSLFAHFSLFCLAGPSKLLLNSKLPDSLFKHARL